MWFVNVNLINNAKWVYEMFKNTNPKIDLIISNDIMMTASIQYADVGFPVNTWMEFENYEVTCSCSNPFLQVWKGGIRPLHDTKDDVMVSAELSKRLVNYLVIVDLLIIGNLLSKAGRKYICSSFLMAV